jgi:bifunctional UDP-N-acetylglucosamine pyrophosphorylase/glucosamine-1-phosphate N-acetyltransferase
MTSALPKVAHRVLGLPLVAHVLAAARDAGCDDVVIVTGHGADAVEALLPGEVFVRQDLQLGTGHAVMCAESALAGAEGSLVVLAGDCPLLTPETIARLIAVREDSSVAVSVLTTELADPEGYGRIIRDSDGRISAIVEDKDLAPVQRTVREVNTSTYCFDARVLFEHLHRLENTNAQGEFYLTDMIALMRSEGLGVETVIAEDPSETLGVNSRVQLAEASAILQKRINRDLMLAGVTMTAPDLVWVSPGVQIGRDVVLEPMTFLAGDTTIAEGCVVGPDSRITDSAIGAGCVVDSSVVVGSTLGERCTVGPRAYLRPGTVLRDGAKVGTSVEIKNSVVGEGSKVPHLSYIGDAEIGRDVNIGAGTITCNYDGSRKHRTVIEDRAFVGSDTMLVAPVTIGEGAVTGAGSTITTDVPADALGVERSEQRVVEGWSARRRAGEKDDDGGSGRAR